MKDYIDAEFAQNGSLAEAARVAGLSPFHALKCFRAYTGLTPVDYRNQRGVMIARRLLHEGQSIAAAAHEVGLATEAI